MSSLIQQRRSRVLVADDTESVRSLFRKLLLADGHDVVSASDGAAALDAVQEHMPDVILLDVSMPRLDGLEVGRHAVARLQHDQVVDDQLAGVDGDRSPVPHHR